MSKPVFFTRGFPALTGVNESMVSDLKVIAELPEKQIEGLSGHLKSLKGFLEPERLASEIGKVIEDNNVVFSIRRVILNLDITSLEDVLSLVDDWRKETKNVEKLSEATFIEIEKKLSLILQPIPALVRYKKAVRLEDITGNPLEGLEIICDVRPIFDETREEVEGLIPYTTLKVVVTGVDGLPISLEAELTAEQVQDLAKKAEVAETKIRRLRECVNQWVPNGLPMVDRTRLREED